MLHMVNSIDQSVASHGEIMSSADDVSVLEDSVLNTELPDDSVDVVVTSPPYGVETASYLRTHLLSYRSLYAILGRNPYEYDEKIIGSEYLAREVVSLSDVPDAITSETFTTFFGAALDDAQTENLRIRTRLMMRFFEDMGQVIERLARWVRPGGHVAFVIGNKRLGERLIPTDEILSELFIRAGFRPEASIRHKLKCNNSNSEVPWQERTIQEEYILTFCRA